MYSGKSSVLARRAAGGFSLPELLVVIGVIALLIAIIIPPLAVAHRQARQTRCAANLQQMGTALTATLTDWEFYPLWDDSGGPVRYTFVDLLLQLKVLGNPKSAYCPDDARPDPLNSARGTCYGVQYPGKLVAGVDYSYGIGVPLSAGGWAWQPSFAGQYHEVAQRRFEDHELNTDRRVLVADGLWSTIYNLSGDAITTNTWNWPSQFDNTVAWRHGGLTANLLMQDGHIIHAAYHVGSERPVDTQRVFVWHPGESLNVGPFDADRGNYYPNRPPVYLVDKSFDGIFPRELIPGWYTEHHFWSGIENK